MIADIWYTCAFVFMSVVVFLATWRRKLWTLTRVDVIFGAQPPLCICLCWCRLCLQQLLASQCMTTASSTWMSRAICRAYQNSVTPQRNDEGIPCHSAYEGCALVALSSLHALIGGRTEGSSCVNTKHLKIGHALLGCGQLACIHVVYIGMCLSLQTCSSV